MGQASRYTQFAEFTPFHLPYDELFRSGAVRQDQEDRAKKEMIDLGNTQFGALPVDAAEAKQMKSQIDSQINNIYDKFKDTGYRNANGELLRAKRDIQNMLGPQGKAGAIEGRLKEYHSMMDEIEKDKTLHPYQAQFYKDNLNEQVAEGGSNPVKFNDVTNSYSHIQKPQEFEWTDKQKFTDDVLKHVAGDSHYIQAGYGKTPLDFVQAFREGKLDYLDQQKVAQALAMEAEGNPSLIKSAQIEAHYNHIPSNESQFYTTSVDPKTKQTHIEFNPETLLGREFSGASYGAAYRKQDENTKFIHDTEGEQKAKEKRAQPSLTGQVQESPTSIHDISTPQEKIALNSGVLDSKGKIDWTALNEKSNTVVPNASQTFIPSDNAGQLNDGVTKEESIARQKNLLNIVKEAASMVGWTGPVDANHYQDILDEKQTYMATRGYDIAPPNVVLDRMNSNIKSTIGSYDAEISPDGKFTGTLISTTGNSKNSLKNELQNQKAEIESRSFVEINGERKSGLKGTITDKDGNKQVVFLRPKSLDERAWFDAPEAMDKQDLDNAAKDNFGIPKEQLAKRTEFGTSLYQQTLIGMGQQPDANTQLIATNKTTLKDGRLVYTLSNPSAKMNAVYVAVNKLGHAVLYQNIGELKKDNEIKWYDTPEGQNQVPAIKKNDRSEIDNQDEQ